MTRRFNPAACAATLAVSMLALTGTAQAQQNNQQNTQQQQQNQQAQQGQQAQQNQQQAKRNRGQLGRMEYQQVRGTIVDSRRIQLRGSNDQAVVVLLETQKGNRAVVDLGTVRQGVRFKKGDQIAVRGRPVTVGNQRVILQANAVRHNGQTYDLNRPSQQASMQTQTQRQGNRQQASAQGNQRRSNSQAAQLSRFDANNDAMFSPREFTSLFYARFDRNNDGVLSVTEWDRGIDRMFGEGDVNLRVSQWDRDGNGRITRQEFRQGLGASNLFARIDMNRNGAIEPNEIRTARAGGDGRAMASRDGYRYRQVAGTLYDRFDRNNDNRLTQNEYRANASNYFGDNDYFSAWDRNGNGWLSDREFRSGMRQAGLFRDWDGNNDGVIDRNEWTTAGNDDDGLFGLIGDDDSLIGEDEGLF